MEQVQSRTEIYHINLEHTVDNNLNINSICSGFRVVPDPFRYVLRSLTSLFDYRSRVRLAEHTR